MIYIHGKCIFDRKNIKYKNIIKIFINNQKYIDLVWGEKGNTVYSFGGKICGPNVEEKDDRGNRTAGI